MFINSPRKKFFISGSPGVGKTTLVEYLFNFLKTHLKGFDLKGFITKEIRERGERKGFKINLLDSEKEYILALKKELLSSKETKKRPFVGKYLVMVENLDKVIEELEKNFNKERVFFIVDEIGKMEILSPKFCKFIEKLLESENYFLATIGKGESAFLEKVRNFEFSFFCEVTKENREFLKKRLSLEFFRKGKLIAVEGIDGAGKTTFSKALCEKLREKGIDSLFDFEPTSGPFGKRIREILEKKMEYSKEDLKSLFLKDRMWHVENLIIPALEEGKWIILDRYYLSTLAYQGSQGFSVRELLIENETIAPIPDLVIYLDLPSSEAFERIKNRKLSFFENTNFLKKVDENYKNFLKLFNHLIVDAKKPLEENLKYVLEFLDSKFKGSFS